MDPTDTAASEAYRLHAELCKVLTEPKRLMILDALRHGERSVGELAAGLDVTLANASQHLAVMRGAGLVAGRRTGTTITYRLAEPTIVEACDVIHRIVERRTGKQAVDHRKARLARRRASTNQPCTMVTT